MAKTNRKQSRMDTITLAVWLGYSPAFAPNQTTVRDELYGLICDGTVKAVIPMPNHTRTVLSAIAWGKIYFTELSKPLATARQWDVQRYMGEV